LKEFCKRFDSIQKIEKEKEERIKKYTKGPGATNRPSSRSGPWPRKPIPNGYPASLLLPLA
jgi:hypothetical protein